MSTQSLWSGGAALIGLVLATAAPDGGGCGGSGGAGGGALSDGGAGGDSGPAGAGLTILATTSGGNGCPGASSVGALYESGPRRLTLTYSPMRVSKSGPGFDHSSCTTGLTVKGVPGWQFAATGVSLHGDVDVANGATVQVQTNVFFAGAAASGERDIEIVGPKRGSFDDTGTFQTGEAPWSPCGQDAIFNIQVGVSVQTGATGPTSVDIQRIGLPLAWQEC